VLNHTRIAIIGTLVVVLCFVAYWGYDTFIYPRMMHWPVDVDSAADSVISHLSEEDKKALAAEKSDDLFKYHFSLGLYFRNQFGLWQGNGALLWSACGECQPDDASGVVIERIWTKLREQSR
jgi:hypothetical protein